VGYLYFFDVAHSTYCVAPFAAARACSLCAERTSVFGTNYSADRLNRRVKRALPGLKKLAAPVSAFALLGAGTPRGFFSEFKLNAKKNLETTRAPEAWARRYRRRVHWRIGSREFWRSAPKGDPSNISSSPFLADILEECVCPNRGV